jgi:microcystin-dependent protein
MAAPFLGEIRNFGLNFAPRGWAFCQGQLLPISQNTALFSLIGTFYGGNGTTNFALPNLQGAIPVGMGQGAGLSNYDIGETGGSSTVTLVAAQLPAHTHTLPASAAAGRITVPTASSVLGATGRGAADVYASSSNGDMAAASVGATGSGSPHNNMMPYLVTNYCIALQGIFPARN